MKDLQIFEHTTTRPVTYYKERQQWLRKTNRLMIDSFILGTAVGALFMLILCLIIL